MNSELTKDPWGTFELEEGAVGRWLIGPLTLFVRRAAQEWELATHRAPHPLLDHRLAEVPTEEPEIPDHFERQRFGVHRTEPSLTLRPALADRAVVVHPEVPLRIPAGEQVTLYISTPLWVQILEAGEPHPLADFPTFRPSNTWFGPNTVDGTLCYASRVPIRHDSDLSKPRLPRANTALRIGNLSESPLLLERMRIPTLRLPLYRVASGAFWTPRVSIERRDDDDEVAVRVDPRPDDGLGEATRIAPPRDDSHANVFQRTLGHIFVSRG